MKNEGTVIQILKQYEQNEGILCKLVMSDEAQFALCVFVNK